MPAAGANWGGRQAPPSEAGSDAEDSSVFGVSFGASGFHGRNHAHLGVSSLAEDSPAVWQPAVVHLSLPLQLDVCSQPATFRQRQLVAASVQRKLNLNATVLQAHRGVVAGSAPAAYFMPPPARARDAIAPLVAAAAMDASPSKPAQGQAAK